MKVVVLINSGSGSVNSVLETDHIENIRSEFSKAGIECIIQDVEGSNIRVEAKFALNSSPDAIVAAGGDGTVSAVASVLTGTEVPLGILPVGTLNHFAKDLHIPLELERAIQVIGQNFVTTVDTGEVNGHFFINNASMGAYPWIVKQRESSWIQPVFGKWAAMVTACISCIIQFPLSRVRITLNNAHVLNIKTPFVFIGNNKYRIDQAGFGKREDLHSAKLCIYTVSLKRQGRAGLFILLLNALKGTLLKLKNFEMHMVTTAQVEAKAFELHVALDGEVISIKTPLRYNIKPASLKVIIPEEKPNGKYQEENRS